MSIITSIINLLIPPRCLNCGKVLDIDLGICPECLAKIPLITAPYCHKCGQPLNFDFNSNSNTLCPECMKRKRFFYRYCRSAFIYDDFSKKLILNFKFNDCTENSQLLAKMMYVAATDIFNAGVDLIVPVPLHYTRLIKRKYNQSALLAKDLSQLSSVPFDVLNLVRHQKTRPQVELCGLQRQNNVKNVFSVKNKQVFKGKRVLLIDDVLTTGATMRECAKALRMSGVKSIDLLSVARVVN